VKAIRRQRFFVGSIAFVTAVLLLGWLVLWRKPVPRPLPTPNAYDFYVRIRQLTNVIASVTERELKRIVGLLEELEAERETKASILQEEKNWQRGTFRLATYLKAVIETRSLNPDQAFAPVDFDTAYDERLVTARSELILIAARAFERERGRAPTNAKEFVPDFLSRIPLHPKTEQSLQFPR